MSPAISAGSDPQHDLSEVLRGLHETVGVACALQGQHGMDRRAQPPGRERMPEAVAEGANDGGLLLHRPGPQRRADDREPCDGTIDLSGLTASESPDEFRDFGCPRPKRRLK